MEFRIKNDTARHMHLMLHPISSLNHLVARLVTDQVAFLFSIFLFIVIALFYKRDFWRNLDDKIYARVINSKETFLKKHAEDFAMFGNAIFHILFLVILSIIFLVIKHKFSIVLSILFALIFSWGFNRLLKLIYKRTRPYSRAGSWELGAEKGSPGSKKRLSYCFPSGHVMASISVYFFSAMLLQNLMPFLPWYLLALIVSISVIISRIYLNHHYFTDVLAGIFMGIFCLNISLWFYFLVNLI